MNGGTLWNQDYQGVNRKPEFGVDGSRTAEPSSKVFAAFGARRGLLSTTRSLRLDAGRLHDRQQPYFLSIAEGLDLGWRGRPRRGAKIGVARG
jgi:hypothetical protein